MAVVPHFVNHQGAGAKMTHPYSVPDDVGYSGTGAGGAATAITITGQTGRPIMISQVAASYSAAPTGGALTITDGTITRDIHVTAAGPFVWYFSPPISMTPGATVTVTLAAPGGAVVGKLSVVPWVQI